MSQTKTNRVKFTDILLAVASGIIAAANLNLFVKAGNLVPGGFAGLSFLIIRLADKYLNVTLPYSVLYLLFNLPCVILVWRTISKRFTLLSLIDVVLTSFLTDLFPKFTITDDLLLISVFGGIINGISNSMELAAGGSAGGMDFLAIWLGKKYQKSMWNSLLVFNAVLLVVSGLEFTWESALYSIIFQYVSTQVMNMFDARYKRTSFFIVTDKADQIDQAVVKQFNHSVTALQGVGGYTHEDRTVLYAVVGRYEENAMIELVRSIDPKAFINVMDSRKIVGNFNQLPY